MAFSRNKQNKEKALQPYLPLNCGECENILTVWPHKTKDSYLITMCEIMKINIEAGYCRKCNVVMYYDTFGFGLVPIHNKVSFKRLCALKSCFQMTLPN